MTVNVTNPVSDPYLLNGVTTVFGFDFKAMTESEVVVEIDGVEVSDADYTVDLDDVEGGSVTFAVAPTGEELIIYGVPSLTQQISFQNTEGYSPAAHDEGLDRSAIRDIYLNQRITDEAGVSAAAVAAEAALRAAGDLNLGNLISWLATATIDPSTGFVPFTPEMFGAEGDGVTDDYQAFEDMIAVINGAGGGVITMRPHRTYLIDQYAASGNGVDVFEFLSCVGLVIEGNGSKLDFKGDFDRAAATDAGIGIRLKGCEHVRIANLELDGNVDLTTNSANASESAKSYGLAIMGCLDVEAVNVNAHHFATDGFAVTHHDDIVVSPGVARASKRITLVNCQGQYNARQGITVGGAYGVTAFNCDFSNSAQYTGTYGVGGNIGHSPKTGMDFEPTANASIAGNLDVDPGRIRFIESRIENNRGGIAKATKTYTSDLSFDRCRMVAPDAASSDGTSHIILSIPRVGVERCYIDLKHTRLELGAGTGLASQLIQFNEIRSNGAAEIGLYSPSATASTIIRFNRIIGTATAPSGVNLVTLTNPSAIFEDNYVFVPKEGYTDAGANDDDVVVNLAGIRRAARNRYTTDLLAASGSSGTAHYRLNYGTTEAVDEEFAGVAPGTADTFRPSAGSTFDTTNKFTINRKGFLGVPGMRALADAAATHTHSVDQGYAELNVPLTANRVLTLSATNAVAGAELQVTRTAAATGGFTLDVGGLKTLAAGQWARVRHNGAAWTLLAFGSL
jgi:hypothetical protein